MVLSYASNGRRSSRYLSILAAAGVLALAAILAGTGGRTPEALGFDHDWTLHSCVNVSQVSSQYRFMDDAPGTRTANDEAVFINVNANDETSERCTWWTHLDVQADVMTVDAAVNDGAVLRVTVHGGQTCSSPVATAEFSGTHANNAWQGHFAEPFGAPWSTNAIEAICITLEDAPATAAQRISALIDRILLFDGTTVTWSEGFGRAG